MNKNKDIVDNEMTKKIYINENNNEEFLAYHKQINSKNKEENNAPFVVFLHGLMSNMNSKKSLAIEAFCQKKNYNFLKFDNFGHGLSSGDFTKQTMSSWLKGLESIIKNLPNTPILLVGSSMGGWLALIAATLYPDKVFAVITLAAAIDFTENLIWKKFSDQEKEIIAQKGFCNIKSNNPNCQDTYPISYKLIKDGRKYLMLHEGKRNNTKTSVHLIHGMQDTDVPYQISLEAANKLQSEKVVIKIVKDANHKLSRKDDLNLIFNSIEELMSR